MAARAIFLRGVNLGAHRRFKNVSIVDALAPLEVTPVGAAGTFFVRGAMPEKQLRARLTDGLGFEADAAIRSASEITALVASDPFRRYKAWLPFVSVLCARAELEPELPLDVDKNLRILAIDGVYVLSIRKQGAPYPDVDKLFGARATTRGWPTMLRLATAIERG